MPPTPFAALNGKRIQVAHVTIPWYGTWCADVTLAVPDVIPLVSTLTLGDLTLTGSVFRMASFSGTRATRIVGGAGGWRRVIPSQGYSNPKGIPLSLLLSDAAALVGETVRVQSDYIVGTNYARETAPASRLLRQLAGQQWWIDNAGVTQIGNRTIAPIGTPFQVTDWSGGRGWFQIATENLSDWVPGRTFANYAVTKAQQIGLTMIAMDNDGKLRVQVLTDGTGSQ